MAALFLSHSNKDDAAATALEGWLRANGFTDIFIDHDSIVGGDTWRQALQAATATCRVVLCLVTENWLASKDCLAEFDASFYMGKRVIPLFFLPRDIDDEAKNRLTRICGHYQGVDVAPCAGPDGILDFNLDGRVADRVKAGLREAGALSRVGLDPEAFPINRKSHLMPFPGLASFGDDDADAALFYGRSREIAETLEDLRKVRAERDLRPFVILGGSGAGKSSLLKAGIIPRLRREEPAWLPLRAFSPGTDPLLSFAEALARSLSDFGKVEASGVIRDRLFQAWSSAKKNSKDLTPLGLAALETALEHEGSRLRTVAAREGATILISIDQAEELVRVEGDSGEAIVDYLHTALVSKRSHWQLAFATRTESLAQLQQHPRFQNLKARTYDLRALPVFRFDNVIEEPARRYGVDVDTALVDALVEDAPEEDALPLLAFAVQRLWRQYAISGTLTKDNYEKVGGLRGLIEDAAERALRLIGPEDGGAPTHHQPPKRRVDIAESTFIPALVQVNEQGDTTRRVAAWKEFSEEQQELLSRFDQWRLVIHKGTETDDGTVEVAHEALFREWPRLKRWLEPERARLEALRSLQTYANTWDRHGRTSECVNHRGKRLGGAIALTSIDGYHRQLSTVEFDYIDACRKAETIAEARQRKVLILFGALLLALVGSLIVLLDTDPLMVRWWHSITVSRPYKAANFGPYVLPPIRERGLEPGEAFRECANEQGAYCPEMIVVPPGSFMMGSSPTETGRRLDEGPQHRVTIAKPFAVSKYEITFAEWDVCTRVDDRECPEIENFWGSDYPIFNVKWTWAEQYAKWLSRMTGKPYRLLTEAEYEYAARGGRSPQTVYPWGDDIGVHNANCVGCGNSEWNGKMAPVGKFAANGFGLFDMVGNVWQWVEDCYHPSYQLETPNGTKIDAPTDGSEWASACPDDGRRRVIRGGSFNGNSERIRSAVRGNPPAKGQSIHVGFRIGRTLDSF